MHSIKNTNADIEIDTQKLIDMHLQIIFVAAWLALCLLAGPNAAHAAGTHSDTTKKTSDTSRSDARKKTVNKVTYQRSSSEETPAQRDRRMHRECKGMHNAGACRGYTR